MPRAGFDKLVQGLSEVLDKPGEIPSAELLRYLQDLTNGLAIVAAEIRSKSGGKRQTP